MVNKRRQELEAWSRASSQLSKVRIILDRCGGGFCACVTSEQLS
jgi:hypothetical protein